MPWYAARPASSASITDESMHERQVGQPLHERDRRAHQLDLVGERVADVDVEHVGAAGDLLRDVDLDPRQVALLQLAPGTPCGRSG